MQTMHVEAGATIFRSGDASLAVYVIEDGEVVITVGDSAASDGCGDTPGGIEVVRLHAGDLFGESGVLEARARAATATATTATTLLVTDAETFVHAFGTDNDRALSLVRLLCRRLRDTSRRAAQSRQPPAAATALPLADAADSSGDIGDAVIRLMPDRGRLVSQYHMVPIEVRRLPFRVGNRYGGETRPMSSDQSFYLDAPDEPDLAAPHFEIVRCDGELGVRDMGSRVGTIVNGNVVSIESEDRFVPLFTGANDVVAGRPNSPFRFRIQVREA